MSRKAMQVALEALESDPISHAGPVTVLSPGKGTGCGYTNINENWTPLYTAPPKREWVGLADEQVEDEWERITQHSIFGGDRSEGRAMYISPNEVIEFSRAIEAKLKEKNHG